MKIKKKKMIQKNSIVPFLQTFFPSLKQMDFYVYMCIYIYIYVCVCISEKKKFLFFLNINGCILFIL